MSDDECINKDNIKKVKTFLPKQLFNNYKSNPIREKKCRKITFE
jgi:hypothetical protein